MTRTVLLWALGAAAGAAAIGGLARFEHTRKGQTKLRQDARTGDVSQSRVLLKDTPESIAARKHMAELGKAIDRDYSRGDVAGAARGLEGIIALENGPYYRVPYGGDSSTFAFLGKVYDRLGEYDEARAAMKAALTEHLGQYDGGWLYPRWRTLYGDLCRRAGDLAGADRQYRLSVKSFYYEKGDFHALADVLQGDELRQAAYASAAIASCGRDFDREEEPIWKAKALELAPNSPFSDLIRSDAYRMKKGGAAPYAKWLAMADYHAKGEVRSAMHAMRVNTVACYDDGRLDPLPGEKPLPPANHDMAYYKRKMVEHAEKLRNWRATGHAGVPPGYLLPGN